MGKAGAGTIGREELKAKVDSGDAFVLVEALPVRYYRHTHLPGAVNLDPESDWQGRLAALLPDKDAEIVTYCADANCRHAGDAAHALTQLGYRSVREYHGGKQDWLAAGYPVEGMARKHRQAQAESSAKG